MTKSCSAYKDKIPAYLDGELGEEDETVLRRHLKFCPQCRRELTKWEEMFSLLQLPQEDPGPGFADSVLEAINLQEVQEQKKAAALRFRGFASRNPRIMKNLNLGLTGIFLLAFSLSCWLLAGTKQLPLIHALGRSGRIIMDTVLDLLPTPLMAVIFQAGSGMGEFLAALLSGMQQKLVFLFSLSETFFVIARAISPVTWAVTLAAGFISIMLLGKVLGNRQV
jgi:anti-sigma factor RsiW